MTYTYECRECHEQSTSDAGIVPHCVTCGVDMVIVESESAEPETEPVAPINVGAYQNGLEEIEAAQTAVDADWREYDRANKYATKRKKQWESSLSELQAIARRVIDRLRPKPLFEAPDTHTNEELVVLLSHLNVSTTIQKVHLWTGDMKADARAWAMAAQTDQPRLIPPFLFLPGADPTASEDDQPTVLEGESAVEYAKRRQAELAAEAPSGDATPPASETQADEAGHHYPKATRKPRGRRRAAAADPEPGDDPQPEA